MCKPDVSNHLLKGQVRGGLNIMGVLAGCILSCVKMSGMRGSKHHGCVSLMYLIMY